MGVFYADVYMDARGDTQSDGYIGIAALFGWVVLLFTAAFLKRAGHIGGAITVALVGDAVVAAVSGWVVRRRLRDARDRENDMDLALCSATLLLVAVSLPVWLIDYLDRWNYAFLPTLLLAVVCTIHSLRNRLHH
jgi:hypothetical protein